MGLLGLPGGAQHLYLVHRDTDGREYVIRSGPAVSRSAAIWSRDERPDGGTADDRGNETPADRPSTQLAFDGMTIDAAWAIMVKYARRSTRPATSTTAPRKLQRLHRRDDLCRRGQSRCDAAPRRQRPRAIGYSSWDQIVEDVAPPADPIFRGTPRADRLVGLQIGETSAPSPAATASRAPRRRPHRGGWRGRPSARWSRRRRAAREQRDRHARGRFRSGSPVRRLRRRPFRPGAPGRDQVDDFQDGIDVIGVEVTGVNGLRATWRSPAPAPPASTRS